MPTNLLINIDVDDLERGVAFYTQALDLQRGRTLFDGTVVELTGASSVIYLLLKPAGYARRRRHPAAPPLLPSLDPRPPRFRRGRCDDGCDPGGRGRRPA